MLTINGTNFGNDKGDVWFTDAVTGPGQGFMKVMRDDILLWTDNLIQVKVPSCGLDLTESSTMGCGEDHYAGTGKIAIVTANNLNVESNDELTVNWATRNIASTVNGKRISVSTRFRNANSQGGYTFIFPNMAGTDALSLNERAAIERAVKTWRCKTGVNFITNPAFRANASLFDCTIKKGDTGNPLTYGVTFVKVSYPCTSDNGQYEQGFVSDIQMVFQKHLFNDPTIGLVDWNTGAPIFSHPRNLEMIALHELGHAHLLMHVNQPDDIMYFSPTNATRTMTIPNVMAIEAATRIIDLSVRSGAEQTNTTRNCPLPMVKVPAATCNELTPNNEIHSTVASTCLAYPNPTNADLFIIIPETVDKARNINYSIYNMLGSLIDEQTIDIQGLSFKIPLQSIVSGIYFVKIAYDHKLFTIKMLKE